MGPVTCGLAQIVVREQLASRDGFSFPSDLELDPAAASIGTMEDGEICGLLVGWRVHLRVPAVVEIAQAVYVLIALVNAFASDPPCPVPTRITPLRPDRRAAPASKCSMHLRTFFSCTLALNAN